MTQVSVDGSEIMIGGSRILLDAPIETFVEVHGNIVVLLIRNKDNSPEKNIIAFDSKGKRLWSLAPPSAPTGDENPYVALKVKDGELWASSWKGMDYRLDPQTGNHLDSNFTK
jgi:outer membrane protein assembly factor BamB